jgi:hypothetical protein
VCEVDLVMTRERVTVEVRAPDAQDAHIALARIVSEANRGYRPFWGPAEWPGEIARKSRYQRLGVRIRDLVDVGVAAAFGAVALLAVSSVPGVGALPTWVLALIMLVGARVVYVINRAVPAVELPAHGRSRLYALGTRLAIWLGAQALALLGFAV